MVAADEAPAFGVEARAVLEPIEGKIPRFGIADDGENALHVSIRRRVDDYHRARSRAGAVGVILRRRLGDVILAHPVGRVRGIDVVDYFVYQFWRRVDGGQAAGLPVDAKCLVHIAMGRRFVAFDKDLTHLVGAVSRGQLARYVTDHHLLYARRTQEYLDRLPLHGRRHDPVPDGRCTSGSGHSLHGRIIGVAHPDTRH